MKFCLFHIIPRLTAGWSIKELNIFNLIGPHKTKMSFCSVHTKPELSAGLSTQDLNRWPDGLHKTCNSPSRGPASRGPSHKLSYGLSREFTCPTSTLISARRPHRRPSFYLCRIHNGDRNILLVSHQTFILSLAIDTFILSWPFASNSL